MDASYSRDCHSDSILHAKISGHIMESEEEMKRGQVFNDDFKQGKKEDSDFLADILLTGHAYHCLWPGNHQTYRDRQTGRQTTWRTKRQSVRQTGRHINWPCDSKLVSKVTCYQSGSRWVGGRVCWLRQSVKQLANQLPDILTYLSADALSSSLMCVNVWLGVTSSASNTLQK